MRSVVNLIQKIVGGTNLPWRLRYVIAVSILKPIMASSGIQEGYIGRYRLTFDLNDTIQREAYLGIYEFVHVQLLRKLLKPGDVLFDVGANIGFYTLLASQIVGQNGRIYSFEPIPENVEKIRNSINENEVSNVIVNESAVGKQTGTIILNYGDTSLLGNSGWASKYDGEGRSSQINVPVTSLEEYIFANSIERIDFVKIDVEGMEYEVLQGMRKLLEKENSPDLFCEVLDIHMDQVINLLLDYGYLLYPMPFQELLDIDEDFDHMFNLFCTKDPDRITNPSGVWEKILHYLE